MEHNEDLMANVKMLLFSALYSWKKIVAVALLLGIVIGGVQAFRKWNTNTVVAETTERLTEEEVMTLNDQKYWAEDAQHNLKIQQEYIDKSPFMRIDYRNVHKATVTYFVDTGYQIQPGSVYQDKDYTRMLVSLYKRHLQNPELVEKLATEQNIEPRYFQDLVRIATDDEGSITIDVLFYDETATKILEKIESEMAEINNLLNETVYEHILTKPMSSYCVCIDSGVSHDQRISEVKLLEYQAKAVLMTAEYEKTLELYGMATPESDGAKGIVVAFAKWAVLGGGLGAVLAVLVIWMGIIFSDKITSEKKIGEKLSITLLGSFVQEDKKYGKFSRWLRKREGRKAENTEGNAQYIAQNLLNHIDGSKNILVCSDVGSDEADAVVANLQKHIPDVTLLAAGNPACDAQALKLLQTADAVVLVVVVGKSCGKEIAAAMKQVQQANKPVAGIVSVD